MKANEDEEGVYRTARSGGNENSHTKGVKITILDTRSCGSSPCTLRRRRERSIALHRDIESHDSASSDDEVTAQHSGVQSHDEELGQGR